ncbi:AAA family ATPase [Bacillus marinisedimentorum]|uniref:AAA family ATPase n=1 Tax=Bacillus marinisedimentorum TaxID=1821260 RepID=UPI000872C6E9|nr:AAA family ATPase [Bacillus marinisedimentorum]
MINTKLILIDGITGSGKSTTAQFLANQLRNNGIKVKWYHEEEDNHPLNYEEDIEVFTSQAELEAFLEETPKIWREFAKHVSESDQVHIIESFILQNTVRLLFQNNLGEERIRDFTQEIEEIIRPLNPALIYFYQENAEQSIRKVWKRRGPGWKKWFVDLDILTPYVKKSGLAGETGVIKLWSEYQNFTNRLVENYKFTKLSIENSEGNWDEYRQRILEFLDVNFVRSNPDLTSEENIRYCGTYRDQEGEVECTIKILNGNLVCDLIWPDIKILPVKEGDNLHFYIESFPVLVTFTENQEGSIYELNLSGSRKSLDGKTLYKAKK